MPGPHAHAYTHADVQAHAARHRQQRRRELHRTLHFSSLVLARRMYVLVVQDVFKEASPVHRRARVLCSDMRRHV